MDPLYCEDCGTHLTFCRCTGSVYKASGGSWETKDSGQHKEYSTGMKRDTDEGKAAFNLLLALDIPYEQQFLTRMAQLLTRGAVKYGARNHEKARTEEELERMKSSALRHLLQWISGETDEDHAAAVAINLFMAESTKYRMDADNETGSR